jgi:hypothetical protein
LADRSDPDVLEYAAANNRIVISHDVNTMPAHAYERIEDGRAMAGLLMARQSLPVSLIIEDLLLIASSSEAAEWQGVVCFLPL